MMNIFLFLTVILNVLYFVVETNLALRKPAYQSGQWRSYSPDKYGNQIFRKYILFEVFPYQCPCQTRKQIKVCFPH